MSGPICILGRQFEPQELTELQTWIDQRHGQSRRALSVGLAKLWDWRNPYGQRRDMAVRLLLNRLEQRFTGACYRAANWLDLGQTTGRTRQDRAHRLQVPPKRLWVYPLDAKFRRCLCA